MCLGFHPIDDLNFIRYSYPNNTWAGLVDPLQYRTDNLTGKVGNATQLTEMYMIEIGNGTVINIGIDRSVHNDALKTTALAEGILPDGVELYGPGWKSEYDIDDEGDENMLEKREQLIPRN